MPKKSNSLTVITFSIFLVTYLTGCTTMLIEKQGLGKPAFYRDCPKVYMMTRMEAASISWVFSGDMKPDDSCLAHFYPKATKDSTFRTTNSLLTPMFLLSFPIDVTVDTIFLPLAL